MTTLHTIEGPIEDTSAIVEALRGLIVDQNNPPILVALRRDAAMLINYAHRYGEHEANYLQLQLQAALTQRVFNATHELNLAVTALIDHIQDELPIADWA